jgi:hypothetical protein
MKKYIWLTVPLLFLTVFLQAQTDTIAHRIVLIGDGGELTAEGKHPVVDAVRRTIPMDARTTILYLGDNIYGLGLPDDQYSEYQKFKAVLDTQLSIVEGTKAKVYMIPGNHDWENGGPGGFDAILREQLYVDLLGKDNVSFFPKDGCPGPVEVNLGNDVTIVLFDSQWWLHPGDKPEIESDCPYKTKEEVATQIEEIVSRNSRKLIILASHHPFRSNGPHGGYFPIKKHIFPLTDIQRNLYIPLPIIGSIYPIARSVFGTPQDVKHPTYQNMVDLVTNSLRATPNVVFVAGHEHSLQWIQDSSYNYIISGSACKTSRVAKGKRSPYVVQETGFAVLEVSINKIASIKFYTVTDSTRLGHAGTLLDFSKIPEEKADSTIRVVDVFAKYKDTITISASEKYPEVEGMKRFVMGQNYRPEWSRPVNMKVFNLTKERGGFTIISLGGGKQTRSLHIRDKNGKDWVLRSVDKNPTQAVPEVFRGTLAQDVVQEFNSAAHPYGALVIPGLAKAIDVVVPHPQLFFVPDDPKFGFYRPLFANTVCMLEEKDPSEDASDTRSTAKVFNKLLEENDHRADQAAVLRARLLDILVADFDRHFDQWRWATVDTGKGRLYFPIPKDRDQAFFYSNSALLKAASRNLLPFLKGFRHDIPDIEWLGYSAKDFDRLFLTDLDKSEWEKAVTAFQESLTDTIISSAVRRLPKEVFPINGPEMIDKLISRRNLLSRDGLKYYQFLSRKVNILGSNQKEYFKVSNADGGLQVRVYARQKGNDTSFIMYDRIFRSAETYEIRLYGLNDDDLFEIDETASSKIKVRIIGGKGNDTFNIRGPVQTLLYDMNVEGNHIKNTGSRTKNRFSKLPPVNYYSILGFKYNKTRFPHFEFGFNSDDGFYLVGGVSRRTHGFRNEPYATDQGLFFTYSPQRGTYRFQYDGEFNHVTRDMDIVLRAEAQQPGLFNFFGLGNTTKVPSSPSYDYFRSRYRTIELEAMMRRRFFDKLFISAGPYFYQYYNKFDDNASRILGKPMLVGLDSSDIYSRKNFLGGKLAIKIDNRNNAIFPTRGITWNNIFVAARGITGQSRNITKVLSDMTVYASLSDPAKVIAVLGLGGGHIFSKDFEFFQAMSLGVGNNNLHAFRKNRFLGKSLAYGTLELRLKLFEIKSYLFPGPFGLKGFYDIGRVWMDGESSRKWHSGYGGGIYFIPFNLFVVSFTAGFTSNEKLLNFNLGSRINVTF